MRVDQIGPAHYPNLKSGFLSLLTQGVIKCVRGSEHTNIESSDWVICVSRCGSNQN